MDHMTAPTQIQRTAAIKAFAKLYAIPVCLARQAYDPATNPDGAYTVAYEWLRAYLFERGVVTVTRASLQEVRNRKKKRHQERMQEIHAQERNYLHAMLCDLAATSTDRDWAAALQFADSLWPRRNPPSASSPQNQTQADPQGGTPRA